MLKKIDRHIAAAIDSLFFVTVNAGRADRQLLFFEKRKSYFVLSPRTTFS